MRHQFVPRSQATLGVFAVVVLVLASSSVIAPAHAAPQSQPTHTLILRSSGVVTNYFVSVSGTIVSGPRETTDTVRQQQMTGYIGGATDKKDSDTTDVIKYTGYITAFSAEQPQLRAILDGTVLRNASILNAHHIQMRYTSSNKTSRQPSRYTIVVSGPIVRGEDTEDRDTPTSTTTVSGWLQPGDSDGFYFRGGLNPSDSSVSRPTKFRINGNQWTANPSTATQTTPTPSPTTTPQPSPTSRPKSHTLVIEQQNGSVGYTVSVSGSFTSLNQTETSDRIAGNTMTGQVGGFPWNETVNDPKDIIHYTGQLRNFEHSNGAIRVTVNGKQIDPDSLRNTPTETPSPTAASTLTPTTPLTSTSTETPTEPPTDHRTASTTVTSQGPSSSNADRSQPTSSSSLIENPFVQGFAGGLVLLIAIMIIAVLYLRLQ